MSPSNYFDHFTGMEVGDFILSCAAIAFVAYIIWLNIGAKTSHKRSYRESPKPSYGASSYRQPSSKQKSNLHRTSEQAVRDKAATDQAARHKAGNEGEMRFRGVIKNGMGKTNSGYITSNNMMYDNQNFEIDFLVLVPKVGLVLVEVKNYAGTVYCTNETEWKQKKSFGGTNATKSTKNASKQVLRTRALLKKLLGDANHDNWPIIPVVVFVNSNATIKTHMANKPQTPVITADMFEGWLRELPRNPKLNFTEEDHNFLNLLRKLHQKEYSHS